jgi:hypothetical protein
LRPFKNIILQTLDSKIEEVTRDRQNQNSYSLLSIYKTDIAIYPRKSITGYSFLTLNLIISCRKSENFILILDQPRDFKLYLRSVTLSVWCEIPVHHLTMLYCVAISDLIQSPPRPHLKYMFIVYQEP